MWHKSILSRSFTFNCLEAGVAVDVAAGFGDGVGAILGVGVGAGIFESCKSNFCFFTSPLEHLQNLFERGLGHNGKVGGNFHGGHGAKVFSAL